EDAEAENKKMQEMITELLEFSKLDYLKKTGFEKVDLSRTAESSLLSFDAFAFEKGVELLDEIEQGISVNGDKKMLERMTDTLLENAINHTAAGRKAGISLKESGDDVILSIKNQGDEIPPDDREKIFELFYHEPESDSDESGEPHFGLGLAIARSIAEKHHSDIEVSCSNGWVEFSVRFPK
ncbi:MAG: sensor histidine kinase, partial [Candidatus Weimeria sp.]